MATQTPSDTQSSKSTLKRGPNQEAVETAQENVTEGYGSSTKDSIISGKPDPDGSDKGRDNKAIQGGTKK
jgi:hypothetical protein